MKDYTGKTVYVGIDVHKKTYSITCICENIVVKKATMQACHLGLIKYLRKCFPNAGFKSAYEAGFSGFVLHHELVEQGIENIVVHPASIEVSARDRVKTDKRDSLKIATQLAAGRLKGIYIPSIKRELYRAVTRLREKFSIDKNRAGNRLKSLLYCHGLIKSIDKKISARWVNHLIKNIRENELGFCIKMYADEWLYLYKKIKEIEIKLKEQAIEDSEIEVVYKSAPGIGSINARVLSNELGDMTHFKNEKGLYSFTGLTPSEHSSGEHRRQGHISRQGISLLRKILVQAAWVAIKKDLALRNIFEKIAIKAGKKRAIVGIARRLIGRIRACFMKKQLYVAGLIN